MTRYTNSAPLPDKTNSQLRDISQSIPPEQSTILSKNKLITGKKKKAYLRPYQNFIMELPREIVYGLNIFAKTLYYRRLIESKIPFEKTISKLFSVA